MKLSFLSLEYDRVFRKIPRSSGVWRMNFSCFNECGIMKIPQSFLFFSVEWLWDFLRLWICNHKPVLSVCGYRCVNGLGLWRDCRFLDFGVSNRGESALLAHDFPLESLVCYTFCARWRWKGDVSLQNTPFPVAAEQADFGAPRAKIKDLSLRQNPAVRV